MSLGCGEMARALIKSFPQLDTRGVDRHGDQGKLDQSIFFAEAG
jgi:hypothetical protein